MLLYYYIICTHAIYMRILLYTRVINIVFMLIGVVYRTYWISNALVQRITDKGFYPKLCNTEHSRTCPDKQ